ncbi:MAG: hypothetical protein ABIQ65_20885 [Thermoanaerobaculia bacterium]
MAAYVALADTPGKPRPIDRAFALRLCSESVPVSIVLAAFVLASARRTRRPSSASQLPSIRSMAYFRPVIDELITNPPPPGYLAYLSRAAGSCPDSRGLS